MHTIKIYVYCTPDVLYQPICTLRGSLTVCNNLNYIYLQQVEYQVTSMCSSVISIVWIMPER